jgi:hypothetical protein
MTLSIMTFSITVLVLFLGCVFYLDCLKQGLHAECRFMLNVFMLSVDILNVIILCVVKLNVMSTITVQRQFLLSVSSSTNAVT